MIKSNKYPLGWISTIKKYNEILNDLKPESIYVRGEVLQYIAGKHSLKYNIPYVWGTNGEDGVEKWKKIRRLKKSRRTLLKKILLMPFMFIEYIYINRGINLSKIIVNQTVSQKKLTKSLLNIEGIIIPNLFLQT